MVGAEKILPYHCNINNWLLLVSNFMFIIVARQTLLQIPAQPTKPICGLQVVSISGREHMIWHYQFFWTRPECSNAWSKWFVICACTSISEFSMVLLTQLKRFVTTHGIFIRHFPKLPLAGIMPITSISYLPDKLAMLRFEPRWHDQKATIPTNHTHPNIALPYRHSLLPVDPT